MPDDQERLCAELSKIYAKLVERQEPIGVDLGSYDDLYESEPQEHSDADQ